MSTVTRGQKQRIAWLMSEAARNALLLFGSHLNQDDALRVLERGGEFAYLMRRAAREAMAQLSVAEEYANEQVSSTHAYPPEYTGPAPIAEQVQAIASLFGLSLNKTMRFVEEELPKLALPEGAEGWFAIPKVKAIAERLFPEIRDPEVQYYRAVEVALEMLGASRRFCFSRSDIPSDRLRQTARTGMMFERIAAKQGGDILVIPAQFGLFHPAESPRRTRATLRKDEFAFGALAGGAMLLTHPKRIVHWKHLQMGCPGDEFASVREFNEAPNFHHYNGHICFGVRPINQVYGDAASVTGFLV